MAMTIELEAYPGTTTAFAVSRGGTGTPASSYPMTAIGGAGSWEYTISVAQNLVGEWSFRCGDAQGNSGVRALKLVSGVDYYPLSGSSGGGGGGANITVEDRSITVE